MKNKKSRKFSLLIILVILFGYTFQAWGSSANYLQGVSHSKARGGKEQVVIYLERSAQYDSFVLPATYEKPERIVIDINGVTTSVEERKVAVAGNFLSGIRFAQYEPGIVRIVLDTKKILEYEIENKNNMLVIYLSEGKEGSDNERVLYQKPVAPQESLFGSDASNVSREGEREGETPININHGIVEGGEQAVISAPGCSSYNVMRLSDPDRLVADLHGINMTEGLKSIQVNGKYIKKVVYAPLDENTVRIVIDLSSQHNYNVSEDDGQITIEVSDSPLKNIQYQNDGDRICLILQDVKLTDGREASIRFYEPRFNSSRKTYSITFSSQADLGEGVLNINDKYLKTISISNSIYPGKTVVTFEAREPLGYNIYTRSQMKDTAVTVLKPAEKSDRLVVIDPGHGGLDPGAVSEGFYEKDFNMDISTRLNSYLKERGINTYMIRENDSFVDLYERAYIANKLNAALFLSIHNNAYYIKDHRGTMTLCFSGKSEYFNGYSFASIIHKNLLSSLGTLDRGIIQRPNLIVLKATSMPSALAEIAYMSNEYDLGRIMSEEFRQKAAEALGNAVVESLERMD